MWREDDCPLDIGPTPLIVRKGREREGGAGRGGAEAVMPGLGVAERWVVQEGKGVKAWPQLVCQICKKKQV